MEQLYKMCGVTSTKLYSSVSQVSSSTELNDYLGVLESLFQEDNNKECYELLQSLETKIKNGEILSYQEIPQSKEELIKTFHQIPIIVTLKHEWDLTKKCVNIYSQIIQTKPDKECDGVKTWFKYEEGVKSMTICGQTVINADLFDILSVLAELDLMKNFIKQFEDINPLGSITPFRLLIHAKISMPVTIAKRDSVLKGFSYIDKEEKTILIPIQSVHGHKQYGIEIPKEHPKYKRVDLVFGFFHIKYINDKSYCVTNCYNVDPKVSVIPWFIINTVVKHINYYILIGLKKQIEGGKNKEVYSKRIEERKDFYEKIKKKMSEF